MTKKVTVSPNAILAILAETAGARACLDAAAVAGRALSDPVITALHVRVDPMRDILPTEEILTDDRRRDMEREAAQEGRALQNIYASWGAALDMHVGHAWLEVEGGEDEQVAALGSQTALNVMAKITSTSRGHARTAFRTCLFETGRPLLVVPLGYAPQRLRRVVIGWKDIAPTRRALDEALPWLRQTEHVTLVRIGGTAPDELEEPRERLAANGVAVETKSTRRRDGISVGAQLLEEAHIAQADWLVTGAYQHGEIVEWMLGGVTRALLKGTTLPIFMCR